MQDMNAKALLVVVLTLVVAKVILPSFRRPFDAMLRPRGRRLGHRAYFMPISIPFDSGGRLRISYDGNPCEKPLAYFELEVTNEGKKAAKPGWFELTLEEGTELVDSGSVTRPDERIRGSVTQLKPESVYELRYPELPRGSSIRFGMLLSGAQERPTTLEYKGPEPDSIERHESARVRRLRWYMAFAGGASIMSVASVGLFSSFVVAYSIGLAGLLATILLDRSLDAVKAKEKKEKEAEYKPVSGRALPAPGGARELVATPGSTQEQAPDIKASKALPERPGIQERVPAPDRNQEQAPSGGNKRKPKKK